jgi:hypothetical protein
MVRKLTCSPHIIKLLSEQPANTKPIMLDGEMGGIPELMMLFV